MPCHPHSAASIARRPLSALAQTASLPRLSACRLRRPRAPAWSSSGPPPPASGDLPRLPLRCFRRALGFRSRVLRRRDQTIPRCISSANWKRQVLFCATPSSSPSPSVPPGLKASTEDCSPLTRSLRSATEAPNRPRDGQSTTGTDHGQLRYQRQSISSPQPNSDLHNLMSPPPSPRSSCDATIGSMRYTTPPASRCSFHPLRYLPPLDRPPAHRLDYPDIVADAEKALSAILTRRRRGSPRLPRMAPRPPPHPALIALPEDRIAGVVSAHLPRHHHHRCGSRPETPSRNPSHRFRASSARPRSVVANVDPPAIKPSQSRSASITAYAKPI